MNGYLKMTFYKKHLMLWEKKRTSQCGMKLRLTESSRATVWATGRTRPVSSGQDTEDMLARVGGVQTAASISIYFFVFAKYYTMNTLHFVFTKKKVNLK